MEYIVLDELVGKTLVSAKVDKESLQNEAILFITTEGEEYALMHEQECCESVTIDDINGDLEDLVGSPLTMAEIAFKYGEDKLDSETWTFFRFATVKGYVTIKFYGTSNGWYSEAADLIRLSVPEGE